MKEQERLTVKEVIITPKGETVLDFFRKWLNDMKSEQCCFYCWLNVNKFSGSF